MRSARTAGLSSSCTRVGMSFTEGTKVVCPIGKLPDVFPPAVVAGSEGLEFMVELREVATKGPF